MPIPITVPRLGWSMDEGTFVGWLKKDGEPVKAGEPLFTLEGDKASQEVEATDSGVLRIPADAPQAGDVVSVGALLGYLVGAAEPTAPAADAPPVSAVPLTRDLPHIGGETAHRAGEGDLRRDKPPVAVRTEERGGPEAVVPPGQVTRLAISPRALRRAAELGVDCRRLQGSGRGGRITEADVVAAAKPVAAVGGSTMRRTIAQRTAESFSRAPHFYLQTEVDARALVALRERLRPGIEAATGVRLTLTDLLLRAQALALRDCPCANAIWEDSQVVPVTGCDIGLVVGLDRGLVIPIVREADAGGLEALVRQRASLVEAARAGQLTAEAMQGGATSLSNLGKTSVDEFCAVIAPPQSSMLAVGRAAPRPFVVEGQLAVCTTLRLCLSVDHRVMDGGPAAQFLGRIVERIEHPTELASNP